MTSIVTLAASGRVFDVAADETVLAAARRAGLARPYACAAGRCASCAAHIVSGQWRAPRQPLPSAQRGFALLCQAVPLSDLVIAPARVASAADLARRELDVTLSAKRVLGDDVAQLVLSPAPGTRMPRLAGQYLDVLLADGGRRPFSIANAPDAEDAIELHVRRVAGNGFTSSVFAALEPGARLRVEGPLGTFVPREASERPLLMVAGGTGFAPIKALIEHFLDRGARRPITLYWGVREPGDLYLRRVPERWARDVPGFRFVPVFSSGVPGDASRAGLVHEAVLEEHPDLAAVDVYMSGPSTMIAAAHAAFVGAGLAEEHLYYDTYAYAPDVLERILDARAGVVGS